MKKDWLRIAIALAVLGGLTVFTSLRRKHEAEKSEKEEESKKLLTANLDDMDRLSIVTPEGTVTLQRRPKDAAGKYTDSFAPLSDEFDTISPWGVTAPYSAVAEYFNANSLIDMLKSLTYTKVIDEKGEKPGSYNLEKPPIVLTLFGKGKTEPAVTIKIGDENSAHSGLYIQASTSPRIVLGGYSLNFLRSRKADEWRKKEIFGIKDLKTVKSLELSYEGSPAIRMTKEASGWQIVSPEALPGDESAIESLLSDLKSLRLEKVVSENADADAKAYGLDHPYATFSMKVALPGGDQEKKLWIGGKIEKDKSIYVRRSGMSQIFAVRYALKDSLTKKVTDLVGKSPLKMSEADLTSMVLIKEGQVTELQKKDGKWALVKPVADEASANDAASFLEKAIALKAKTYVGRKAAATGKPLATLRISAGANTKELSFSTSTDGKELSGRLTKPELFYTFEKGPVDELIAAASMLRERRMPSTGTDELSAIQIQKNELSVNLSQDGEGTWKLSSAKGMDAASQLRLKDAMQVSNLVQAVERLSLDAFADNTKWETVKSNELKFEFQPKKGNKAIWQVGKKEDDQYYIWSEGRKIVGKINASKIEDIENILTPKIKGKG